MLGSLSCALRAQVNISQEKNIFVGVAEATP
jgi:hypothetical protein